MGPFPRPRGPQGKACRDKRNVPVDLVFQHNVIIQSADLRRRIVSVGSIRNVDGNGRAPVVRTCSCWRLESSHQARGFASQRSSIPRQVQQHAASCLLSTPTASRSCRSPYPSQPRRSVGHDNGWSYSPPFRVLLRVRTSHNPKGRAGRCQLASRFRGSSWANAVALCLRWL